MKLSRINMDRWACEIIDTWLKVSPIRQRRFEHWSGNDFLGIRDNNSILSIDLNQDEDEIIIERDSPGYSSFQCLSDIGTSLVYHRLWSIPRVYTMANSIWVIPFRLILWPYEETCLRGNCWVSSWTLNRLNFEINGILLLLQQRIW